MFLLAIYIGFGAALGAIFRWWLSQILNSIFPIIPLGTLSANLIGGFLIGIFLAITKDHAFISETLRLMVVTGFLGGLTTFSTFSAETTTLILQQQFFWAGILIFSHVAGSIFATIVGIWFVKLLIFVGSGS